MSRSISLQIVRFDTLNSCARFSQVSCLLRHSTSNNCCRRSTGLMLLMLPPLAAPRRRFQRIILQGPFKVKKFFEIFYMHCNLRASLRKSNIRVNLILKEVNRRCTTDRGGHGRRHNGALQYLKKDARKFSTSWRPTSGLCAILQWAKQFIFAQTASLA